MIRRSTAAATAIVGFDLLNDDRRQSTTEGRVLTALRVTGSAVVGDTLVSFEVGDHYIGEFPNTALLVGDINDDIPLGNGYYVPPGAKVHAFVVDAPATNPIIVQVLEY